MIDTYIYIYIYIFFFFLTYCCCSVTQSCPTFCDPVDCRTPGFPVLHHLLELAQICVHWVPDGIQPSSVVSSSSCLQSFPTSGSFLMSQLLASGGQSIGASVSASLLPMNIQDWFPLELTGLISLQLLHTDLKFCAYFVNFLSNLTLGRNSFMGRSKGCDVPGIVLLLTSKR